MPLKPILKWAGGKRQLLPKIDELLPEQFNKYYEPFIGAGALFFEMKPSVAYINDINTELYILYSVLSDPVKTNKLIKLLDNYILKQAQNPDDIYNSLIGSYKNTTALTDIEIAARLIYLNKTCFNGLYRVNKKGHFNVPRDKKRNNVNVYDVDNIIDISNFFINNSIHISNTDFEIVCDTCEPGDFVYFDPPYDKLDDTTMHTAYSKDGFNKDDQIRLFELFKRLSDNGVYCMLSNNATPFILDLYKDYKINIVKARRSINSNKNGRSSVDEVIITNY